MIEGLKRILGVSRVLIIQVVSVQNGFRLEGEFINLEDGQSHRTKPDKLVSESDLGIELRKTVNSLLAEK
jgi:hypothetical protein